MNKILSVFKLRIRSIRFSQIYNGMLVFTAIMGAAIPAHAGEPSSSLPELCNGSCAGINQNTSGISSIVSDSTTMDIHQNDGTANLNWNSFNIGTGNTVEFHQPGAEAIAINKIFGNDPSKIYGNLIANGNVYLINSNGIIFGKDSQVNVRSLIASTLDIQRDENGDPIAIADAINDREAAFEHDGNTLMGVIRIEEGAVLTTERLDEDGNNMHEAGGRIMIFAPQIDNAGEIRTPEGQTILAASHDKVYLRILADEDKYDKNEYIRGFYVEVETGGDVNNLGNIIAERGGNITLMGMAVNQSGLVQATTTVSENGSIRIIARDSVNSSYIADADRWRKGYLSNQTGTVVFGEGSTTQVIPEKSDTTKAVDDLEQLESWVEAVASDISVENNAEIRATGGRINLVATDKPGNTEINEKTENRIYLAEGSVLDVSGSNDAVENMERNVVEVELRSNELKDSPIQRDGALRGETVYVDIREGTDLADISGAVSGIERGVDERLSEGGEINLTSSGDVLVEEGVNINISGGQVEYQDGYISTTQLLKDGELIDIADADRNVSYDGLGGSYTITDEKWGVTETWQVNGADTKARFEQGYIEGKDAGSLNISSNTLVMEGNIDANVTSGTYQRDGSIDGSIGGHTSMPNGGSVIINLRNSGGAVQNAIFAEIIDPILKSYVTTPPATEFNPDLQLSTQMLKDSGLSNLTIDTYGDIDINKGQEINLAAGASLDLTGGRINLDGNIKIIGGDVSLQAEYATGKTADVTSVILGGNAQIDVRGNWVNDTPELNPEGAINSAIHIHGGDISLSASSGSTNEAFINLQQGSVINASGGAWLQADGKLKAGNGGNIAIAVDNPDADSQIKIGGELISAGITQGGNLKINADTIRISDSDTNTENELVLTPDFFNKGGFGSYSLTAHRHGLAVDSGTVIDLIAQNLQLNNGYALQQSGNSLEGMTALITKPEWERGAVDLTLSVRKGDNTGAGDSLKWLSIGDGAQINTGTGGNISLNSTHNIYLGGALQAHGGDISLQIGDTRSDNEDAGYIASQGIWLGENAQIDVSAAVVMQPNDFGLRQGQTYSAGNVLIDAQQGYVIAQQGSNIDVSGTSAVFDINGVKADGTIGLTAHEVAADAGSITIKAAEGMLLNGTMQADAADVNGARGGSLTIVNNAAIKKEKIEESRDGNYENEYLENPGVIHLHDTDYIAVYATGSAIDDEMNGIAHINSSMIENAGFDGLSLQTTNINNISGHEFTEIGKVVIDGGVNLQLRDRIQINTTNLSINGDVELSSAYAAIGRFNTQELAVDQNQVLTGDLYSGNGHLSITSDHIDLMGEFQINGAETINLHSSGDIRLNGSIFVSDNFDGFKGELTTTADLNLSARQVYATTLSDYKITIADNPEGIVTIGRPDGISADDTGAPIMSVGGNITVTAPQIYQGGVLRAPGGEITLQSGYLDTSSGENGDVVYIADLEEDFSSIVSLASGSITSVALSNEYNLFGIVNNGLDWKYQNPYDGEGSIDNDYLVHDLPEKKITIDAVDVELTDGAVVDISSSGDLYAYEFVPGIGGSTDVLTNDNASGSFAIIPTANNPYGYNDLGLYEGFAYEHGSQVYLSGMDGLAAGYYTILPARYALLPGSYLVTPASGYQNILPGQTQYRIDSAPIIAGRYSSAGTDMADSLWSGFIVEPGSIARTRSEYFNYLSSPFFTAKSLALGETIGRMPIDAGHLALSAVETLIIENTLNADPAAGGRGAWIDIDTPNIKVYSDEQQLPVGVDIQGIASVADGSIYISAQGLNDLGADSILLGGTRSSAANGTLLDVGAENVEIMQDTDLEGYEIMLAANEKVLVAEGATIAVSGVKTERNEVVNIAGDGALLRVSAADQIDVVRTGVNAEEGELIIEEGAMVSATSSMLLQGTKDTLLSGDIQVGTENQAGSLYLGASQISLSNDRDISTTGLILPTSTLEQFNLDELIISSYGSLNIYNGIDLQLNNLKIEAAAINGIENEGSVANITVADTLTLSSPHQSNVNLATDVENGNGALNLNAGQIVIGSEVTDSNEEYISQSLALNGFSQVTMAASNGIVGKGDVQINFGNTGSNANLTLATPMLTVASGSSLNLNAPNAQLDLASNSSDHTQPAFIGGKLSLNAESVNIATRIDMSGGLVDINAVNDINIDGTIDVSGQEKLFYDLTKYVPAGSVSLISQNGDVNINPSVDEDDIRIDVSSGSADGGKAGTLSIGASKGTVNLDGNIAASGVEKAGSILLDVGAYNNFDALFATLNQSGFTDQIGIRLRNGDMNLGQVASNLYGSDITLTADNGSINLDQITIDASGDFSPSGKGGEIAIWADKDLNVGSNSFLNTAATAADSDGGNILLSSQNGTVVIDNAANINLSGATGGDLQIRAERTDDDVKVALFDANNVVTGADAIRIEAFKQVDNSLVTDGKLSSADINTIKASVEEFMSNCKDASCQQWSNYGVTVMPGVDVVADGDLRLTADWNLKDWRYADVNDENTIPGQLTIRTSGSIYLDKDLSDGVETLTQMVGRTRVEQDIALSGESWAYRINAGADIDSANQLQTLSTPDKGDLVIASDTKLRSGTGDIDIAISGDLKLMDQSSVIYTFGQAQSRGNLDQLAAEYSEVNEYISGQYFDDGGDITINVGGDIIGSVSDQLQTSWQHRVSTLGEKVPFAGMIPTVWGISIGDFQQGIASFGGGDISISSGGDITDLSVSIASTRRFDGELNYEKGIGRGNGGFSYTGDSYTIFGDGNMSIASDGNIFGGVFSNDYGSSSISSSADIGAGTNGLNPIMMMLDGQADVFGLGDTSIQAVMNPSWVYHSKAQPFMNTMAKSSFFYYSYGTDSSLNLGSLYGDIDIVNTPQMISDAYNMSGESPIFYNKSGDLDVREAWNLYPTLTTVNALGGSITLYGNLIVNPDKNSTLNLLADGDIVTTGSQNIILPSVDPELIPSLSNPTVGFEGNDKARRAQQYLAFPSDQNKDYIYSSSLTYLNNFDPLRIVSLNGSFGSLDQEKPVRLFSAKPVFLSVKEDIFSSDIYIQNLRDTDVSAIMAGGNISFYRVDSDGASTNGVHGIKVAGPGRVDVIAGGDIDLASSKGIYSIGNKENAALAETGADVTVMAGVGDSISRTDYSDFINRYLDQESYADLQSLITNLMRGYSGNSQMTYDQSIELLNILPEEISELLIESGIGSSLPLGINSKNLLSYMQSLKEYQDWLGDYLLAQGIAPAQDIAAMVQNFEQLPVYKQRELVMQIFFNELKEGGKDGATKGSDAYDRGYAAIYELYQDYAIEGYDVSSQDKLRYFLSQGTSFDGELSMYRSKVQTEDGGDINILVPGGRVFGGEAAATDGDSEKEGDIGVVARREGDVNAFTRNDFLVNQSRVFAMDGGDILMWSSETNLDAGRGAKTARGVSFAEYSFDQWGNVIVSPPTNLSGSGIRNTAITPGVEAGNVYLFAPIGVVDAGDAGIGTAGNLFVGAVEVKGADNFDIGGVAVGVQVSTSGDVSGMTGAGDVTSGATSSALDQVESIAEDKSVADEQLSWLEVFVEGLGGNEVEVEVEDEEKQKKKPKKKKNKKKNKGLISFNTNNREQDNARAM